MIRSRLGVASFIFAVLVMSWSPLSASEPIPLGTRRELFVDAQLVDHLRDATIELCEPREREKVLELDEPWEGIFSAYTTIIRDGEMLRMYYRGGPAGVREDGTNAEVTCYAESADGIHWTKPKLGLFEVAGSKENNVVLAGMCRPATILPLFSILAPMFRPASGIRPSRTASHSAISIWPCLPSLRRTASIGISYVTNPSWDRRMSAATGRSTRRTSLFGRRRRARTCATFARSLIICEQSPEPPQTTL